VDIPKSPYQQGYDAYRDYFGNRENCYPPGTVEHQEWQEGFDDAVAEWAW
jgi:hypothetical protein